MKIGLPRGLLYYSYEPFLKTFFEELPVDVEISEPTDQRILDKGTASCIGEAWPAGQGIFRPCRKSQGDVR